MLIIETAADMARALDLPLDAALKRFLILRRDQLGRHPENSARFLIVEPRDTLEAVEVTAGYPLLIDDVPTWGYALPFERRWIEIVIILSDDGLAEVILVPVSRDADPRLLGLLDRHGILTGDPTKAPRR